MILPYFNGLPQALDGVSCVSKTFCWAGGDFGQMLHWNGHRWSAPQFIGEGEKLVRDV
jgi:hypothetical protein